MAAPDRTVTRDECSSMTFARLALREIRLFNYQSVFYFGRNIVKISLRLWPTKDTFDLGDLKNCQEGTFENGSLKPRCYSLISEEFSQKRLAALRGFEPRSDG